MRPYSLLAAATLVIATSSSAFAQGNSNSSGPAPSNSNSSGPAPSIRSNSNSSSGGMNPVVRDATQSAIIGSSPVMKNLPGPNPFGSGLTPAAQVGLVIGTAIASAVTNKALNDQAGAGKTRADGTVVGGQLDQALASFWVNSAFALPLGPVPALGAGTVGALTSASGNLANSISPGSDPGSVIYRAGINASGNSAIAGIAVIATGGAAILPVMGVVFVTTAGTVIANGLGPDININDLLTPSGPPIPNSSTNTNRNVIPPDHHPNSNSNSSGPAAPVEVSNIPPPRAVDAFNTPQDVPVPPPVLPPRVVDGGNTHGSTPPRYGEPGGLIGPPPPPGYGQLEGLIAPALPPWWTRPPRFPTPPKVAATGGNSGTGCCGSGGSSGHNHDPLTGKDTPNNAGKAAQQPPTAVAPARVLPAGAVPTGLQSPVQPTPTTKTTSLSPVPSADRRGSRNAAKTDVQPSRSRSKHASLPQNHVQPGARNRRAQERHAFPRAHRADFQRQHVRQQRPNAQPRGAKRRWM